MVLLHECAFWFIYVHVITHLFLINFFLPTTTAANAFGNETDRLALLKFKESIVADPHGFLNSWNGSVHFCNWHGITCGRRHQRVTALNLPDADLDGTISPYIGNLSFLRTFRLLNNSFSGKIPQQVDHLLRLRHLNLSSNMLEGEIPVNLTFCSKLSIISIASNHLTGKIPSEIGSLMKLVHLDLRKNNLIGRIPPSLGNLSSITLLSLLYNHLVGNIPEEIGRLRSLSTFAIASNKLSGMIPRSIFNISSIKIFSVALNEFRGSIPPGIGLNMPNLLKVFLGANKFSGQIPPSFSNASQLQQFDIEENNFVGLVPTSFGKLPHLQFLGSSTNNLGSNSSNDLGFITSLTNCSNLEILSLSSNNFGGVLPNSLVNFSTHLTKLFLGGNPIVGTIPETLGNLNNLTLLSLDYNLFTGIIPASFGKLQKMQELYLNSNRLSGRIPSSLGNLTQLSRLWVFENELEGSIPPNIGNCPNLREMDISHNKLSGDIPSQVIGLSFSVLFPVASFLSLSSNNLNGIIPESLCNSQFHVLDLSNNSLSGTVPQCLTTKGRLALLNVRRNNLTNVGDFSDNCQLETLDISENHLQGQFLKSLVNCTQLEVLNLGNNLITEPFPCFLRNLATLRVLILRSNKFYGRIRCRKTDGTWPVLHIIDLAHNNLIGEVPGTALTTWQAMRTGQDNAPWKISNFQFGCSGTYYTEDGVMVSNKGLEMELVNILTIFTSIDFSCNKFNGSIPEEIGELKSLYALNLSNNAFTGAVPSSLSNLSELESLDLSKNKLSGQIPLELTKLTFLEYLNLSYNQLVGRIPSGAQFSTFDAASFQGNKRLWGPPLTADNGTGFSSPKLEGNHSNPGHEIDWDIICPEIGFTCGFGIAIGSLLFCKRWRKWYYTAMYNMLLKIFPQLEQRFGHHRRHVNVHQRYWRR